MMAAQMEAQTTLQRSARGGTVFELRFPDRDQAVTPAAFAVYVPPRHQQASHDGTGAALPLPEAGAGSGVLRP